MASSPVSKEDKMEIIKNITDFNLEIQIFLIKLKTFQEESNIVDKYLIANLKSLVVNVEKLLENPETVSCGETSMDIEKHGLQIHHQFKCTLCNRSIATASINEHLLSSEHLNKCDETTSNDKQTKKIVPNQMKNELNSIILKQQANLYAGTSLLQMSPNNNNMYAMQELQKRFNNQNQLNHFDPTFHRMLQYDQHPVCHNVPGMRETRINQQPIEMNYRFPITQPTFNTMQPQRLQYGQSLPFMNSMIPPNNMMQPNNLPNSMHNNNNNNGRFRPPKIVQNIPAFAQPSNLMNPGMSNITPLVGGSTTNVSDSSSTTIGTNIAQNSTASTSGSTEEAKGKLKTKAIELLKSDINGVINDLIKTGKSLIYTKIYQEIQIDIEEKLKDDYPDVKVYLFGSRVNGLGTKEGDLDIYIDIGNTYNGTDRDKSYMTEAIKKTEKALKVKESMWKEFEAVTAARTPILRALNIKLNIDCDFSFSNGLSHCNTQLIRYLLELQPVCYEMSVFIKSWGKKSGLGNKMSSYSFILLVIFYLQKQDILPSIECLQRNIKPFMIGAWQANFVERSLNDLKIKKCTETRKHLIGFFLFYNEFPFDKMVICPYLGVTIPKECFDPFAADDKLPNLPTYKNYMKNIDLESADPRDQLFACDSPMCIQDPFELVHNVVKGVKSLQVLKFANFCKFSANELQCLQ